MLCKPGAGHRSQDLQFVDHYLDAAYIVWFFLNLLRASIEPAAEYAALQCL